MGLIYCNCGNPVENRDTGLCASCAKELRKSERLASRPVKAKKPIKPRSATRAKQEAEYLKESRAWLEGKECARCGRKYNLSVHHMAGRTGAMLLNKTFWLPLCVDPVESCHQWVTEHPAEALKLGFSVSRLAK